MLRKVALCLTLVLLTCLRAAAQDRSTPESTVVSFITAYGQGDIKSAAACVKGVQISAAVMDAIAQQVKKQPAVLTLSEAKTTVAGSSAVVTGQVVIKPAKAEKTETLATDVNLVQSDGMWQIVPDAAKAHSQAHPDLVNSLAYTLVDAKILLQARDSARAISCLSNVKQVCLGALMFVQDNDEVFKLKAESYKKSLMPYLKNESIFKCPSDSGGGVSYAFNAGLVGIKQANIHAPAETVMIYEGKNGKLDFRHDGKATVGFADGHAKLINAEAAKKLRWKP